MLGGSGGMPPGNFDALRCVVGTYEASFLSVHTYLQVAVFIEQFLKSMTYGTLADCAIVT